MSLIDTSAAREDGVPVPAVRRATRILDLMALHKGPVTGAEISRETGMAKSSISNLLETLQHAGLVRKVERGWLLGYRLHELGQSVLSSTYLVNEFHRLTNQLPALRDETALIGVLDGLDVLYLARHNGKQPVRLATDIGHRLPAVVTSLGKAMLAALPREEMNARLSKVTAMPHLTDHSYRTMDELRENLEEIRTVGYSIDDQQNTSGITCFGVAIAGLRQPTAVSTTLLSYRATPQLRDRLILDLLDLSKQLSDTSS